MNNLQYIAVIEAAAKLEVEARNAGLDISGEMGSIYDKISKNH